MSILSGNEGGGKLGCPGVEGLGGKGGRKMANVYTPKLATEKLIKMADGNKDFVANNGVYTE